MLQWGRDQISSQVVELVVEGLDLDALLLNLRLLLDVPAALRPPVAATTFFGCANGHIEVGDLVSILAGSWHLDRTGPVVVEVAQSVGQLLKLDLSEGALVEGHMEVGRKHTALVGSRWHHEEVKGARLV